MKIRTPSILRTLYWKRKQRSLRVRTWDDLLAERVFDGASLAVVGNAGYLKDARLGSQIDGHGLVLRMNNFGVEGFEQAVGRRIDVFMTNFSTRIVNYDNPAVRQARLIVSSRPNNFRKYRRKGVRDVFGRSITAGMHRLGREVVYVPTLDFLCDYTRMLGEYPTTGAMAILLAADWLAGACRSVFFAGFSFFEGRSHYFSDRHVDAARDHNLIGEKELLSSKLAGLVERGSVTLDPVMQECLWPTGERS